MRSPELPQAAIFDFMASTKKPLNLSIQGLFDFAVWLHDLDSNR
jgi:hypothetical protein